MSERLKPAEPRVRYGLIDTVRGFAVVNMILYHLCYDLFCYYSLDRSFDRYAPTVVWEQLICFVFILTAGVSLHFSRRGYRRGLTVLCGGILVSAATLIFLPSEMIWFGILHFLGCAILLGRLLRRVLERIPPLIGAGISLLLFAVLRGLPGGYLGFFDLRLVTLPEGLYGNPYLAFLGLPPKSFFSADFFPILPWLFLFFCGYFLWEIVRQKGWDRYCFVRVPVLDFIGRHSLLIYLLHQPVLFGILYLVFGTL